MPDLVDLRSDTVTAPSPAMRRAMAEATVGDDGFGEDPTVTELEVELAARLGKEAAVFVPTGTMGNQIALRIMGVPGTRVVAGRSQHVVAYERGAAAVNARVQLDLVDDADGVLEADAVQRAVDANWLDVSAVFVENTHMEACGTPWDLAALDAVVAVGRPIYMDGARLFNASVATGIDVGDYAARADVVMTCLSKGLGAPVGSVIAGRADDMERARLERKRLGGSMRQSGVLAAPALLAVRENVDRLADDHARARRLAEAVAERWPGTLDPERVRTNIVVAPLAHAPKVVDHLAGQGVLATMLGRTRLRLVTHLDVDDAGIDRACRAVASAP
jgi:threonine aldolase